MKTVTIPTWLYLPLKILLCLGLLSPVFIWAQHLMHSQSMHKIAHHSAAPSAQVSATHTSQHAPQIQHSNINHQANNKISGIDVSHFQGLINWPRVAKSHVRFAYIKATNGNDFIDPEFNKNWHELRATTLYRGAYHFFLAADDPVEQAKHFVNTVGKLRDNDLPPMLDIEISDHISNQQLEQRALIWLKTVEELSGRTPIVYTDNGFADSILTKAEFAKYPLWIAEYSDSVSTLPSPWKGKQWSLWQHSEQGQITGINGHVDLDVFNGTETDLKNFINDSKRGQ